MENELSRDRERRQALRVSWGSGPEFLDLTEILEHRATGLAIRVYTSDIREDGRIGYYQPLLEWLPDNLFSLTYDDHGEFESGENAEGDLGRATYRQSDKGWTCVWNYADGRSRVVKPSCKLFDTGAKRELELVIRAKRDRAFRLMIFAEDEQACAITGEGNSCVLDAAHVVEVRHGGRDLRENGLALRKDIHSLFDARLLTIEADGCLLLDSSVEGQYRELFSQFTRVREQTLNRIRRNLIVRNAAPDWP